MRSELPIGLRCEPEHMFSRQSITNPLGHGPWRLQLAAARYRGGTSELCDGVSDGRLVHTEHLTTLSRIVQLPKIVMTTDRRLSTLSLPMVEKTARTKAPQPLPMLAGFARLLNQWIEAGALTNSDVGALIGYKDGEMVRRYRTGTVMPRMDKLAKLAKQIGMKPVDLLFPDEARERKLAGMLNEHGLELSADELHLIAAYRQMPVHARKALRANAVSLLEEHGAAGKQNPWGKGTQ